MSDSDHNRWHEWILENQDKWFLYARRQTRSEADARDVLQESILSIWQEYGAGNNNPPPHPGVIFAAIRFRALNHARNTDRRQQREQDWMDNEAPQSAHDPLTADGIDEDEKQLLLAAVNTLPKQLEEVLTLHIWGELTFQEIADTCGCSINTVTGRYRRALEKLRSQIKNAIPFQQP